MDLKQFFQVVRRRWITIVVLLVLALGVGGAISYLTTPLYESKSEIYVSVDTSGSADSYTAVIVTGSKIPTYAELATSSDLMSQVIDDLELNLTPQQLADRIDAEVVTDTTLIEITVRDPDPQQAQAIGRLEAQRFSEFLVDVETPSGSSSAQIVATVTEPASFNGSPVSPQIPLNMAVAALIGLLLGLALAVAREVLDRTITTLAHLQELTEAPVLASVGYDDSIKESPLLTDVGGFAPRTEAFRLLRTNLQFIDLDRQPRCLVISSAVAGEGKTMTSTNLAVALAQAGRRILLIDGDLRRPRIAGRLGLDAAVGLTTVLIGSTDYRDAIQVHEASGLHFLASGAKPPNPTEILQSRVTQELIKDLRNDYDMVIIDAPPLLPVADAAVLSTLADGTIIVIKHGKTTRDQVAEAIVRLNQVGGRLFGAVVNMIPKRAADSYYYYYYEESAPAGGKSKDSKA